MPFDKKGRFKRHRTQYRAKPLKKYKFEALSENQSLDKFVCECVRDECSKGM